MAVSSNCEAEILKGTLTYKYFPSHKDKNILLEFFKICYASVGTELIHLGNQIYFKLWHISQLANLAVPVAQSHGKAHADNTPAPLHLTTSVFS